MFYHKHEIPCHRTSWHGKSMKILGNMSVRTSYSLSVKAQISFQEKLVNICYGSGMKNDKNEYPWCLCENKIYSNCDIVKFIYCFLQTRLPVTTANYLSKSFASGWDTMPGVYLRIYVLTISAKCMGQSCSWRKWSYGNVCAWSVKSTMYHQYLPVGYSPGGSFSTTRNPYHK